MATSRWAEKIEVDGQRVLEADSRIVDSLKNIGYSFEASIADLVDNSIDAGASQVLVRFLRTNSEIHSLVVVDNGKGMNSNSIDVAMQFGGRRKYSTSDLGMYGMGLKSASLSQADSVSVFSRSHRSKAVGRRWTDAQAKDGWKCDVVKAAFAQKQIDRGWTEKLKLGKSSGTVVRWDEVREFQKASGRVEQYLQKAAKDIAQHLGLQLHRIISAGQVEIFVDAENIETGVVGVATRIQALDPFSYDKPGAAKFPKVFKVKIPNLGTLPMRAHIWPARSRLTGYRLGGGAVAERQGFYFYRNDRLIQAGGWNGIREDAEPHLSLARVAIDLPRKFEKDFSVRFSKSGVDAPRAFGMALKAARAADGTTFPEYLERAIQVYRTRDEPKVKSILSPGTGMKMPVRGAFRTALPVSSDGPIDLRWAELPVDQFFKLDRDGLELTLNKRYRRAVLGARKASAADAPLVKALLVLLLNDFFRTKRESAIEKATLAGYQAILLAAVNAEATDG